MTANEREEVLIGTSGDYPPFSAFDPRAEGFEGMDIEAAQHLGSFLDRPVRFVRFSWPDMMDDLLSGRFDIAMGGVSKSRTRAREAAVTNPYMTIGSGAVVRKGDEVKYPRFAAADKPGVRVILNQGGSNDRYFTPRIKNAEILRHDRNEEIAMKIRDGHADVWITDNVEALYRAATMPELTGISPENPYLTQEKVYLLRQDDLDLLEHVNNWIDHMFEKGEFQTLQQKWIGTVL